VAQACAGGLGDALGPEERQERAAMVEPAGQGDPEVGEETRPAPRGRPEEIHHETAVRPRGPGNTRVRDRFEKLKQKDLPSVVDSDENDEDDNSADADDEDDETSSPEQVSIQSFPRSVWMFRTLLI